MNLLFTMDDPSGHRVEWHGGASPLKWAPLGVTAFRESILNGAPLQMCIEDATATVQGPATNISGRGRVTFVWPRDLPITVFGLIPQGWLPAAVCESTLLLPDANLAGSFSLLEDEMHRVRAKSVLPDVPLMSLGTSLISPMLAAFEAGNGRFPSRAELADRAANIAERLQRGFPDRKVVVPSPEVVSAGFAIIEEMKPAYDRDADFLRHVYPLIAHRVDNADLTHQHAEVDAIARRMGVTKRMFLYMLVIDCLYDDGPIKKARQRPGRLVLKPKKVFTDRNLFNALCDVMNIEFLCKAHMIREGERPVLCTMDHGLAQAWALFGPHDMCFESGKPTCRLSVDDSFALRMSPTSRHNFLADPASSSDSERRGESEFSAR